MNEARIRQTDRTLQDLGRLYARMDQAYGQAATAHGFVCNGCEDNCCRTLFYHHTLAEYLYLKSGLAQLPPGDRERIVHRAGRVVEEIRNDSGGGTSVRVLCPLNEAERCRLYAFRPMICRLHGIPHELRRPDGQRQIGPGCGDFDRRCGQPGQFLLDRTPLYAALADLERRLRRQMQFEGRIRMTIAQMLTQRIDGVPVAPV